MAEYGEKLGDQEAMELFKLIDQNGDGRITFDEFVLMMMAKWRFLYSYYISIQIISKT